MWHIQCNFVEIYCVMKKKSWFSGHHCRFSFSNSPNIFGIDGKLNSRPFKCIEFYGNRVWCIALRDVKASGHSHADYPRAPNALTTSRPHFINIFDPLVIIAACNSFPSFSSTLEVSNAYEISFTCSGNICSWTFLSHFVQCLKDASLFTSGQYELGAPLLKSWNSIVQ